MSRKSKKKQAERGRPKVDVKIVTTSIGIHPVALERLDTLAKAKFMSRSALIIASLRQNFPSVFDGL